MIIGFFANAASQTKPNWKSKRAGLSKETPEWVLQFQRLKQQKSCTQTKAGRLYSLQTRGDGVSQAAFVPKYTQKLNALRWGNFRGASATAVKDAELGFLEILWEGGVERGGGFLDPAGVTWRFQPNGWESSMTPSTLFSSSVSLNLELTDRTGLSGQLAGGLPVSAFQDRNNRQTTKLNNSYLGSRHLNSGPNTCIANMLTIEPFPCSAFLILKEMLSVSLHLVYSFL